ncbi:MAG: hypothetical protein A3H93_18100 [Rhodocyclales bacterium RIFCSPLOWO2_02_FULL_63_24]|nr:MAG: hypothetical protein A3H93_18100 [Rhodocyclales bacterium RIFCSPLOWO2_02_FULL_63_24]
MKGGRAVRTADIFIPTPDQVAAFSDAHRSVHEGFDYTPDLERWRTPEHWLSACDMLAMDAADEYRDDCDGHALLVRRECRKSDLPNRLGFCWVPPRGQFEGGYHLGTECGGWWSCCNHAHIIERERTGYVFISLSGYQPGEPWHYVKGFDPAGLWPHQVAP